MDNSPVVEDGTDPCIHFGFVHRCRVLDKLFKDFGGLDITLEVAIVRVVASNAV